MVHHVVAIVASSGGGPALREVFADLTADLPAAVVVAQHLSVDGHHALPFLGSTDFPVAWARTGAPLNSGQVLVSPPGMRLRIDDKGICQVGPCPRGARDHPFDALFTSLATSLRDKVIAIVLTGSLDDGAAGACAVRKAGGTVIVQTEESASYPSMPRAAIAANGADLVVPLCLIGKVTMQLLDSERSVVHPASAWRTVEAGRLRAQTRATIAQSKALRERAGVRREQVAAARTVSRATLTLAATRHAVALLRDARKQRDLARLVGSAHEMAADAAAMAQDAQDGYERAQHAYRLAMARRGNPEPGATHETADGDEAGMGSRAEGMVRE